MPSSSQRIWLTGASSGIGEALIAPLVASGARVAISARRGERLTALAARFPSGLVRPFPLDVTDRAATADTVRAIDAEWGGIDLAVFNAGTHIPVNGTRLDAADFETLIRANYLSLVYGIEAVVPGMLARRAGHIAGVASVAGYRALPTAAAYGASKAAAIYALEALRFDLQSHGIDVTVINPGFVRTPLTDRNTFDMPALIDADQAARIIARGLARRKKEIHFPARFSWSMKLLRVLPFPIYERLIGATLLR
jgi:NADP-dependent 3-hydroxy acid dehydrogenase YdfG